MARKRKPGKRTKSGRLSRAYKDPEVRDLGTPQVQTKRQAIVGEGADPGLSATVAGVLYARGHLNQDQYIEAIEYRRLHNAIFGHPWGQGFGMTPFEENLMRLKAMLDRKDRRLTGEERHALLRVCHDEYPMWYYAGRLGLKLLDEDLAERTALIDGLNALVAMTGRQAAA